MKVAIVGSGISACACAVRLKEKGIAFTVFERMGSPGGKLLTERIRRLHHRGRTRQLPAGKAMDIRPHKEGRHRGRASLHKRGAQGHVHLLPRAAFIAFRKA